VELLDIIRESIIARTLITANRIERHDANAKNAYILLGVFEYHHMASAQ
jgi:hypothetical protein